MLYPNLKKAMGIEGITKTDISRVLHIHFNTVTDRLEENTSSKKEDNYQIGFSLAEAFAIHETLLKKYDFRWLFYTEDAQFKAS